MASERDSTLSRAQEMADKLLDLEKERDTLQVCDMVAVSCDVSCDIVAVSCDMVAVSCDVSCDMHQELFVKSSGEIDRLQDELDEVNKRYVTMVTLYSMPIPRGASHSHQLLEREVESESGALQQRLEIVEGSLGEKERELAEARERIASLTDELVISQGKV